MWSFGNLRHLKTFTYIKELHWLKYVSRRSLRTITLCNWETIIQHQTIHGAVLLSKSLIELGRNQLDKFLPSPFCLLYQAIQGNQPSIFRIRRTITFSEQFYPNSVFNTSLINSIKCKVCGYSFTSSLMLLGLTRTESWHGQVTGYMHPAKISTQKTEFHGQKLPWRYSYIM